MDFSWIPNAISLMRLLMIAPIILLFVNDQFQWALLLFAIAGLSDGIDGWIAKKYDWNTRLGKFLDPAADKLLVAWSFGTLAYIGHIPAWLAVVVIGRDVVIVTGSFMYHYLVHRLEGDPTFISKFNTALEFTFLILLMLRAGFGVLDDTTITVVGAAVLVTVVISGYDYVAGWVRGARAYRAVQ
ncbi:MAG: CDP-alcohol phosphatidyltransferase family protein [Woeseiaceae bacterium]|nr:CDP-alcohol phosphatidyltransferase family protein [Woeseiaceae bacterium]NIP20028.1 CDP-alcohol phosphatidyltransferase family protein [Woeseiaceae bacterium]NIS88824.1 CDP-alcohol phosphatidyltransferase family protein [Woeseiaceae bacterium]